MAGTHFVSLTFLLVMLATLSSGHFVGFFRFVAPLPQPPPPPPPPPPTTTTSSPTPLYRAFFNVAQNLPLVLYNNLVCNTLNQNTATRSLASRRLRYIYYTKTCASTAIPSSIVDVVDYTNLMKKLSSGFLSTQERQAWTNALNSSTLTVLNTIVDWAFGDTSDADIRKVCGVFKIDVHRHLHVYVCRAFNVIVYVYICWSLLHRADLFLLSAKELWVRVKCFVL